MYAAQQQMDQASGISGSLKNVGYPIESLEALDRIYRVDLSVVREDSYVFSQISQYMNNGHSTLKEYDKEKKRDEVAKQLVKLLQGDKNPRLAGFFTLLGTDSRNARQQVKGIPSLLPRLLGHYKGKPTLKELDAAVDQAYVKYANDPHVLGMYCAINLYTGDKKAWSEAAAKLLPLVTKNKALKQSSLPWVVALAGFENGQVNKDLESLLNLVLEEGKKSRQTLRQKQIVAVLTKATTKYKVPELSAVMERLVGGSYSPEGHVELGIGLLEAKQLAEAERVLGMVWKKDSKFIMESFEKVAPAYAKAGKIDLLIKSFSTVTDQQILNNNSYRVVNAASSLTNKKETLEDGIKLLYKAAEKAEANRDYAMRNLVSTLTRKKRVDEALKAYHAHIMPPKGKKHNSTLLAGYAKLAFDNKVIAELEKDCRKHIKETPEWEANGQLLLAICQRLQDNEKLFDDLVDRMGTDPAFKTKMQSFGSTLTEELSKCKSEKPLRFALAELQRLASNSRGSQSHQGYVKVAGVYAKLNERSKALASFDNALSAPMPNYGGDYQIYQQYRRSVDVADAMVAQGFALAGLKLYDKCIEEADTELIRNYAGSNNAGRLQTKAEAALGKAMVEDLKSTLDQLIRDAGNRKEDLGGYFFVSKRPFKWPVRSKFPQKLRNAKLARQQLLLALLAEAKSTNRTSELRKALTDVKLDEPSIYRQALVAVTSEQFDSDAWIKRVNTSKQTKSTANMMVLLYLLADKQTTKDGVALFRKTLGQDLKTSKPQQLALLVDALPRYASEKLLSENQAAAKRLKRYNESEMKRAQSRNQNLYAIWHLDQLMVNNPSIENKFARAQLLVKLNRFKPAIAQYQEVVKTKPEHFAKLAGIQARTKDWKSASQSFIAGLKEKPDDHWDWFRSSILSAHLGDEADYKRQCDEMVKRYAEKSEWWLLERMVKANAISAKPSNLKKIAEVIDKLAKKESSNHWVILSKGIVDYRTGKFDSALTHLDKAITSSRKESKYASSLGFAFKAMSLQKKKKSVEAKKALENAQADFKAIQVRKDGMLSTSWHDWLMSDMAIKEASSLVK